MRWLLACRTRESRQELRKFMRNIRRANPERGCFLEYDRLYVDHKCYIWNDILGQVGRRVDLGCLSVGGTAARRWWSSRRVSGRWTRGTACPPGGHVV